MNENFIIGTMRWKEKFNEKNATLFLEKLVSEGFLSYDLADIYGCYSTEKLFGNALKSSQIKRENLYLITKFGIQYPCENNNYKVKSYNTTAKYIAQQVENSLKHLQTDYLDLLLVHRPDPLMNYEEVAETFYKLQQQGKVKELGVSNFNTQEFEYLHSLIPLRTNQVEFSIMNVENMYNGTLLQLQSLKIRPQIWSPLGNYFQLQTEQKRSVELAVEKLSKKYSVSSTEILTSFILKHPSNPIIVIGSCDFCHILETKNSLFLELEREDWFALLESSRGKKIK